MSQFKRQLILHPELYPSNLTVKFDRLWEFKETLEISSLSEILLKKEKKNRNVTKLESKLNFTAVSTLSLTKPNKSTCAL